MRRNKFVGTINEQEGADFSYAAQLTEQNATQVFNMSIRGECSVNTR